MENKLDFDFWVNIILLAAVIGFYLGFLVGSGDDDPQEKITPVSVYFLGRPAEDVKGADQHD